MPVSSCVLVVLHGLDEDGVAINFHQHHDVLVAMKRLGGKLACLVGEHGFVYHVRLGVHVAHFLAMEGEVSHVSNGAALTLVDRTLFLVWFRCPFAVSIVSG
jgi:hypothetical protein